MRLDLLEAMVGDLDDQLKRSKAAFEIRAAELDARIETLKRQIEERKSPLPASLAPGDSSQKTSQISSG